MIKQGYLLKRSNNLRGDWKRRFFVLDSRGMLYYYRKEWGKATVSQLSWSREWRGGADPRLQSAVACF